MSLVEALPNRLKYILQHIANTEEEEAEEQNIQAFKLIIKKSYFSTSCTKIHCYVLLPFEMNHPRPLLLFWSFNASLLETICALDTL